MPVFEPSTWAEVSEAQLSRKGSTQTSDPFVQRVRAFTDAPERFLTSVSSASPQGPRRVSGTSDTRSDDEVESPAPYVASPRHDTPRANIRNLPRAGANRNDGVFDDPLGLGRVDVEAQAFVRKAKARENVEEFNLCPAPVRGKEKMYKESPINLCSDAFDPAVYLGRIHKGSSLEELKQGKVTLGRVLERLVSEAEKYRREKYPSTALVEAALEQTKIDLYPISPFAKDTGHSQGKAGRVFEKAEGILRARYEKVRSREMELTALRRTHTIFARNRWIFSLGAKLRAAVTEDIPAVESAVKEFIRAQKWMDAQDGTQLALIETDIVDGFNKLINSLLHRLSTGHFSRQDTARLVAVLSAVDREAVLIEALEKRMAFALNGLSKSSDGSEVTSVPILPGDTKTQAETTEIIARCNSAFFSGLLHIWRLGRVLSGQEPWQRMTNRHLLELCRAYVEILRENLFADVSMISRDAVKGITSVGRKALNELQIPVSCLGPLVEVTDHITEQFLRSASVSVRLGADRLAAQAVEANTDASETASHLQSIVVEALEQVDESLLRGDERLCGRGDSASPVTPNDETDRDNVQANELSGLSLLARTCAEVPGTFARDMQALMEEKGLEPESASLKLAAVCSELRSGVLGEISKRTSLTTPFDFVSTKKYLAESDALIREIQEHSTNTYVRLVSEPLKSLAARLVSFPEEELEDSISRAVPIKIEGISKTANEVTLQLALITITTRRSSGGTDLLKEILLSLIKAIGETLVDVLSTDKLIYHRAAQLWVDVTYVQDMITRGADSDAPGVQEALDGYSRVKERAVQAVLADGYSFSIADMSVLRDSVVATGIKLAQMVQDCFRETWTALRAPETDDE